LRFNRIEPGLKIWVTTDDEYPEFMISNVEEMTEEEKRNSSSR
jgi:hypothetical protein